MLPNQRLYDDDGYEVCLCPFIKIGITAGPSADNHVCNNISNTGLWDQGWDGRYGPNATPIYAPFSGTITASMTASGQGNTRVLSSSNQVRLGNNTHSYASFMWGHDLQLLVNLGDSVTQGQLIGYTGDKDISGSPHCHMGLYVGNWPYGNYIPTCYNQPYRQNIHYMTSPASSLADFFYGNDTENYSAYNLPIYQGGGPTPPTPEPYSISIVPTSKSVFIPKAGAEFLLTFDMTGTPYSGQWNWYPDVSINGNGITLEQQTYGPGGYPWVYTEYTGQDGNRYINTHAEFKVKLSWLSSLAGLTGTYTITFTQHSTDDSSTRQSVTLTISYEYDVKKGAVLFLRYDGGDAQIR